MLTTPSNDRTVLPLLIVIASNLEAFGCGLPSGVDPLDGKDLSGPPAEILRTISGDDHTTPANSDSAPASADDSTAGETTDSNDTNDSDNKDDKSGSNKGGITTSGTKSSGVKDFEVIWISAPPTVSSSSSGGGNSPNRGSNLALLDGSSCPLAGNSPLATINRPGKYTLGADTVLVLQLDVNDQSANVTVNEVQKGKGPKAICLAPTANGTVLKATLNANGGNVFVGSKGNSSNVSLNVGANHTVAAITGLLEGNDSHLIVRGEGLFRCGSIVLKGNQTSADCPQK